MCQGARGAFIRMPLPSLLFLHCNGACQHCSVSTPLRVSQQRLSTHLGACGLLLPDLSHLGGNAGRQARRQWLWCQIVAADWQVEATLTRCRRRCSSHSWCRSASRLRAALRAFNSCFAFAPCSARASSVFDNMVQLLVVIGFNSLFLV